MVSLGTQPANRKSGFGHSSPTGARAQDLSRQPARPDLWGARVSNDPGLPDRSLAKPRDVLDGELLAPGIVGHPLTGPAKGFDCVRHSQRSATTGSALAARRAGR